MTGTAIFFLILALVIIWGGLIASMIFLAKYPQVAAYPPGATAEDGTEELTE